MAIYDSTYIGNILVYRHYFSAPGAENLRDTVLKNVFPSKGQKRSSAPGAVSGKVSHSVHTVRVGRVLRLVLNSVGHVVVEECAASKEARNGDRNTQEKGQRDVHDRFRRRKDHRVELWYAYVNVAIPRHQLFQ